MSDISKLTQALYRGKTWTILDKSFVTKGSKRFADAFGKRLTKQGFGKFVPVAGVVLGGALNWTTLEGIIDTADLVYRRRFLLDKYPHLDQKEALVLFGEDAPDIVPEDDDETISVLDEVAEAPPGSSFLIWQDTVGHIFLPPTQLGRAGRLSPGRKAPARSARAKDGRVRRWRSRGSAGPAHPRSVPTYAA